MSSNINIDRIKESVSALGLDPPLAKIADLPSSVLDIASSIKELDLSFNDLSSLEGLEKFPNLEKLIVDNNALSSIASLPSLPRLKTLWANKNQIANQEEMFAVLASRVPGVTYLSLLFNPCCPNMLMGNTEAEYRRYRVYAKHRLPSLINLDSAPVSAEEAETAKKKGQFFQTADGGNAQTQVLTQQQNDSSSASATSAGNAQQQQQQSGSTAVGAARLVGGRKSADELFADLEREITQQRGDGVIFGIQRHVYTGKSSEGNRFIGNDMLR